MPETPGGCPFPHGDGIPPAEPQAEDAPAAGSSAFPGCPVTRPTGGGPAWQPAARDRAVRTARAAAPRSHLAPDRAERMAQAAAESRAERRGVPEISELFLRSLGQKLGHGHPLSDRTGMAEFTWTEDAQARLREVPEFCRELTRWRVEWTAHKLGLGTTITPEVMQVKYEMWGRVSHAIRERHDQGLPWTDDAYERFERIPDFVKGQVLEAVEGNARSLGATVVDSGVVDRVVARWASTGDFHEGLYGFR